MEARKHAVVLTVSDDIPTNTQPGTLIPGVRRAALPETPTRTPLPEPETKHAPALFVGAVLFFALALGVTAYHGIAGSQTVAAPIVVVDSMEPGGTTELTYGARVSLSEPDFFAQTKEGFITAAETFIEADLDAMVVRLYDEGEVTFEAPILSKGKEGSWWETPAGLYEVEAKKVNHFSSFGQVWQPWSMVFQGNFFIHGWPYYPDGEEVPEGYSGGCIRLDTADAEALYALTPVGTPVLVHERDFASDGFVYEPKVPEVDATEYLVADIKSSTVLASSDMDAVVPIASITKLMTALIAAEYINLDSDVRITQERYVTTLIPRLEGRSTASMYSLLQLLLVESSNEAAEVIAAQIGRERFVTRMNEKAASLGLMSTTFVDPSGLENGNRSSLRDLLRLIQYIHNNRSFILELSVDADLTTAYQAGDFGELENFNAIDGVENLIGGKVGETQAAGQTSVTLHRVTINDSERVIAIIVLGSEDRPAAVVTLLNYVTTQFDGS